MTGHAPLLAAGIAAACALGGCAAGAGAASAVSPAAVRAPILSNAIDIPPQVAPPREAAGWFFFHPTDPPQRILQVPGSADAAVLVVPPRGQPGSSASGRWSIRQIPLPELED